MRVESYDVGRGGRVWEARGGSRLRQAVSRAPTGPCAGVCVHDSCRGLNPEHGSERT